MGHTGTEYVRSRKKIRRIHGRYREIHGKYIPGEKRGTEQSMGDTGRFMGHA
jgi:hypothetical protein